MAVGAVEASEPTPRMRGPGQIIFLHGASSSGKSTLAKALQQVLDEPFCMCPPIIWSRLGYCRSDGTRAGRSTGGIR
jgi:hypothetical protein